MTRPWSTTQLKKLGECIRDGREISPTLPDYDEVMSWYNDQAALVQREIESIDFSSILGPGAPTVEVTSRAKTIDTLREKLIRDHGMALPSIQDVAGVRVDASMVLSQQDEVAASIANHFDQPASAIQDLRLSPHSGYRAVHVILRLDARVEIQVRTVPQSEWANSYEALGDVFGRGIRYGELPQNEELSKLIAENQELSTVGIARIESINDATYRMYRDQEVKNVEIEGRFGTRIPHDLQAAIAVMRTEARAFHESRLASEADFKKAFDENRRVLRSLKREGGV